MSDMAKKFNSVIGVDIGSQMIKVAEVKLQGRQPVVTALGMAPTPPGVVDHVGVHDGDSIGAVLKDVITACGASVADAVVSISGQGSVLVRTLEVPKMTDSELKQHMEWEITRNIPFAESTVVSDFKAFPAEDGAQNMDVVMAIATQSSVDTVVAMLKRAGKKAAALDVQPLSLARCLDISFNGQLAGKHVCMVEVGHKTTSINIYRDGQLLMPREVPVGGELFTRSISDGLNTSEDEARRLKEEVAELPASGLAQIANVFDPGAATVQSYNPFADDGAPMAAAPDPAASEPVVADTGSGLSDEANRIYQAMQGSLDEFISEVRRSIDYYRSKGGEVDMVFLCGGGSKIKGMDKFLSSGLGLDVEYFDPLQNVTLDAKKSDPGMVENSRQDFAVAIGNGLHICF